MSRSSMRLAVVGAGAIGPSHAYAIEQIPGVELVAICDQMEERAAALAAVHDVAYFSDVSQLLRRADVDAVTLCTPSGLHLDTALAIIAAGKHLLVEKPLEITTERVDRLIAAAAAQNVKLACVYQSRFRPIAQRLKALVDDGILGELYSGSAYTKRYRTQEYYDSGGWRGTWEIDGGGCLMNQGIHLVDLLLWFMGDATRVMALTSSVGRTVEVETLAVAMMEFSSGARGVIEGSSLAYPELPQYLEIFGSRGTAKFSSGRLWRLDLMDPTPAEECARDELLALSADWQARQQQIQRDATPGVAVPHVDMGHGPVVEEFVAAIREDRPALTHGVEARRAVALITAIYASGARHGQPVELGGESMEGMPG